MKNTQKVCKKENENKNIDKDLIENIFVLCETKENKQSTHTYIYKRHHPMSNVTAIVQYCKDNDRDSDNENEKNGYKFALENIPDIIFTPQQQQRQTQQNPETLSEIRVHDNNKDDDSFAISGQKHWNISKTGVAYSRIRNQMETFDMIFFRGSEPVSNFISWLQKKLHHNQDVAGSFTHVGMIIKGDHFPWCSPYYAPGKIYVFESTQSGLLGDGSFDVNSKSHLGVQLRDLDKVAETYDSTPNSKMAWGKMRQELRPNVLNCQLQLMKMMRKYNGLRYDASFIDLTSALWPFMRGIRRFKNHIFDKCCCLFPGLNQKNWIFCSELVAHIYRDFGILSQHVNPENVLPCDFLENPQNAGKTFDEDNDDSTKKKNAKKHKTTTHLSAVPLLFESPPILFTTRV